MEEVKKMNVLVLGGSGAGKSTLIRSISGIEVITGVGEGNTQKIDVYESNTWPIRCIDTKGFEYSVFEQWQTIRQVKKYTKEQLSNKKYSSDTGIDAVWYCVEGTARRTFLHNIMLMNKAIKGWKNIPVFAVITKSYSEIDIPENIEAVQQAFAKSSSVNLKKIIPVVAEEYVINEEVRVAPKGIEELCLQTLDCIDEAKKINQENRARMVLEQKRFTANGTVVGATASAVIIGAVPVPFPDSVILMPLETGLTKIIFKIYGVDYSVELVTAIVGSTMITTVAKTILKSIPIAGAVVNGVVAGAIVFALGESVIAAAEAIYTEKLDPTKINETVEFISEKVKNSAIVGATISYFEKNADESQNKKPKEIFDSIVKSINKNK
ncbi:MAG: 50S ribosome-binding GTPase [Bacilli bacterium]|nr:50S ribosome-binding GTPase [Bacilli bacterium]